MLIDKIESRVNAKLEVWRETLESKVLRLVGLKLNTWNIILEETKIQKKRCWPGGQTKREEGNELVF